LLAINEGALDIRALPVVLAALLVHVVLLARPVLVRTASYGVRDRQSYETGRRRLGKLPPANSSAKRARADRLMLAGRERSK